MPLSDFQRVVALLIAANRGPDSHIAGGAVLNRGIDGVRISDDLDIFQDSEQSLITSVEADEMVLRKAGYAINWLSRQGTFRRAIVSHETDPSGSTGQPVGSGRPKNYGRRDIRPMMRSRASNRRLIFRDLRALHRGRIRRKLMFSKPSVK